MTTYTLDTHATIRELQDAGMDSRQAEAVVAAISRSDAELATKTDLKAEIAGLEASTKAEIAEVKVSIAGLETKMWKAGITLAGVVVLLNKLLDWLIP